MEAILVNFECNSNSCKRYKMQVTHGGLDMGKIVLTQAGSLLAHLVINHTEFDLENYMKRIKSVQIINLKELNITSWMMTPSPCKTHYIRVPTAESYISVNNKVERSLINAMKGTPDITLDCLNTSLDKMDSVRMYSQFITIIKVKEDLESVILPKIRLYRGLKIVAESCPFNSLLMYNSWSTGVLCNIMDENLALVDMKLVQGCEGCPVFMFKGGRKQSVVGLIINNILHPNQELTGFAFMVLVPALCNIHPKIKVPIEYPSLFDDQPDNRSVVKVISNSKFGSGVVIREDGIVLTSSHVLSFGEESEDTIRIKLGNELYDCKIVFCTKRSASFQLAILEIVSREKLSLKPIPLCTRKLKIGESVKAIGYSLLFSTYQPSICQGVIRCKSDYYVITTCVVHSGCSGGALIDKSGHLIGIVTANFVGSFICPSVNLVISIENFVPELLQVINERNYTSLIEKLNALPLDVVDLELKTVVTLKQEDIPCKL